VEVPFVRLLSNSHVENRKVRDAMENMTCCDAGERVLIGRGPSWIRKTGRPRERGKKHPRILYVLRLLDGRPEKRPKYLALTNKKKIIIIN